MWTATPIYRRRRWIAATTVMVLTASVGFAIYRRTPSNASACPESTRVVLAVAPSLKAPVDTAIRNWLTTEPVAAGRCVRVTVQAAEPADVASTIAKRSGLTLNGVAEPSVKTDLPDIWIPDSSMWLTRLTQTGIGLLPEQSPSLAQSPIVLAAPQTKADEKPTTNWSNVTGKLTGTSTTKLGVVDPLRDSSGLLGVLALRAGVSSATGANNRRQALTAATMAMGEARFSTAEELLARVVRSNGASGTTEAPNLALLPESTVLTYNAKQPAIPLLMLDGQPPAAVLDYPFVVLPYGSAVLHAAATGLLKALSGPAFTTLLTETGLRPPSDSFRASRTTLTGPDDSLLPQAIRDWISLNMPARMLVVVDVSGSMSAPVPAAGGATREAVTIESARQGISMCEDDYAVGLWTFSTQLDGVRDYKELVPVKPLSESRAQLLSTLLTIQPKPGGATGLYDTILAGYAKMQSEWDTTRVNTLIVMTDGKNEDPDGPSLDAMIEQLQRTMSKLKPVQIVILGIGLEVSETELRRIAEPTGGAAFVAPDPSKMGEIFLQIMALRTVS